MANAQRQPMSWVSVDPDAAHDHVEYTGLVVPGAMTSSTPKKDHPSTFFECHLIATGRVSTSAIWKLGVGGVSSRMICRSFVRRVESLVRLMSNESGSEGASSHPLLQ